MWKRKEVQALLLEEIIISSVTLLTTAEMEPNHATPNDPKTFPAKGRDSRRRRGTGPTYEAVAAVAGSG